MSESLNEEFSSLVRDTRLLLGDMQDLGIDECLFPARSGGGAEDVQSPETLEDISCDLGDCRRCALCEGRDRLVFGGGNPAAELVFVGEAPGREENKQGIPFVGEAGQLLERIIFAMNLKREDVYICNVIKCRPPGNRDPQPKEIETCEPFLKRQLAAIGPKVLVTLGRFAAQTLLRDQTPISRLRGQWHQYAGISLMPTYHPAYLLRNPTAKKEVWSDIKMVMQKLDKR